MIDRSGTVGDTCQPAISDVHLSQALLKAQENPSDATILDESELESIVEQIQYSLRNKSPPFTVINAVDYGTDKSNPMDFVNKQSSGHRNPLCRLRWLGDSCVVNSTVLLQRKGLQSPTNSLDQSHPKCTAIFAHTESLR